MSDPDPLLSLIWLASPALPVGGFSYSEGLEAAIDAGRVRDEAQAGDWLRDQLALVLGRSELPLVAAAWRAWQHDGADLPRIAELNGWALATRESAEFRLQMTQMGRSLADWLRQRRPDDERVAALRALSPAPAWPIGFALAAAAAPLRDALLAFGFGWAENMTQAAVKAIPLGQSAGQRLLDALARDLPAHVQAAIALDDDGRQAFCPMLAVLSAQHEVQYSRLFRS